MIKVTIETSTSTGMCHQPDVDGMNNDEDLTAILMAVENALLGGGFRFNGRLDFLEEDENDEN